jgi:hypothetical protein
MLALDPGQTVHVKVVKAGLRGGEPVIEFVVLDEGPAQGQRVVGRPDDVSAWIGAILDYNVSYVDQVAVPMERIVHRTCRAVIGWTGRLWPRAVVKSVLPS